MSRTVKARIKSFPEENKTKKWTNSANYKKWVRRLKTAKKTRHTSKEDLCVGSGGICKNDLGIPRKYMPQFTLRRAPFSQNPLKKFRKYIKNTYNVKSYNSVRKAEELKPAQAEISRVRVNALIEDNVVDDMEVPLVVSSNGYIADGHHRWAAFRLKAPKKPMKVVVVDAPIKDVLGMAVDWGATTHDF